MLKIVLDTNVLVSGIIVARGSPAYILDRLYEGKWQLITSPLLLTEFSEVIVRPHIARKYPQVIRNAEALLDFFRAHATMVVGKPVNTYVNDDPDDDAVVACAIDGQANYIVSGDPHLVSLQQVKGIPILTPRQFQELLMTTEE
ncbi:MAG: putative toxin-antitoxin system toxin component, PIN family [Anaerolineae bacterium]|nr:putative toxin-antitoxin system toxin component, PIN family [Anaerolineae bacterium]